MPADDDGTESHEGSPCPPTPGRGGRIYRRLSSVGQGLADAVDNDPED